MTGHFSLDVARELLGKALLSFAKRMKDFVGVGVPERRRKGR
jgi:hypothetical protein